MVKNPTAVDNMEMASYVTAAPNSYLCVKKDPVPSSWGATDDPETPYVPSETVYVMADPM